MQNKEEKNLFSCHLIAEVGKLRMNYLIWSTEPLSSQQVGLSNERVGLNERVGQVGQLCSPSGYIIAHPSYSQCLPSQWTKIYLFLKLSFVCVKACPPSNLEVCALRSQVFIGLRSLCGFGRHVILLSTADSDTPEEAERSRQRRGLYEDTHF